MIPALALIFAAPLCNASLPQDPIEFGSEPVTVEGPRIGTWLSLAPVDRSGRIPFSPDAVFATHLLTPDAAAPTSGLRINGSEGEAIWAVVEPGDGNRIPLRGAGWAFATVSCSASGVWLARLDGASRLVVNGDSFPGDVYRYGFSGVPVPLRAGVNHVFVSGARGSFDLSFSTPKLGLHPLPEDDLVAPLLAGFFGEQFAALAFANSSREPTGPLEVIVLGRRPIEGFVRVTAPGIPGLGLAKLRIPLRTSRIVTPGEVAGAVPMIVLVRDAEGRTLARRSFEVPVIERGGAALRSFSSDIDGSVQKWAAVPSTGVANGLVLSLHGASVDCLSQARAYAAKESLFLACPTNRRPYGFDWQDWGRADAYEVLAEALRESGAPSDRVMLTGHSMGGHGAWHLAVNDADRWAAVAPSAGWASFDSYGGRPKGARDAVWRAADGASETLSLLPNLRGVPLYVLHGEKDDNVPLSEMEALLAATRDLGLTPDSHVEPGAGHWWGNACVDWPPIFELFATARTPALTEVREVDFRTPDPASDSRHHWVEIEQLLDYSKPGRIQARRGAVLTEIALIDNVRRYRILDERGQGDRAWIFDGVDDNVQSDEPIPAGEKSPSRSGPFKRAFGRRFVMVVGTRGDLAEDALLRARARYDASQWWYRANATPEVVDDREFLAAPWRWTERNVILYGNQDSNAAWNQVVPDFCPFNARRGQLTLGGQSWDRDDLAALCVYPRADDALGLVGLISDTGTRGARLGDALRLFVSGVGYPDYVVWGPEVLAEGDGAVLAAGFFDYAWQLP
ncbi:MAG: prolyl oligopeptidase family serine peptidase [Planctomycetota bacterium]|nr:prolyl oligopeptidase family serine peptidase [Planctomycetota bacterium]